VSRTIGGPVTQGTEAPRCLLHWYSEAANQPCDLAEISIVPVFDQSGEFLNALVVTPQTQAIVAGVWFNLRSRLLRHKGSFKKIIKRGGNLTDSCKKSSPDLART
jgi:hypothetical protein